MRGLWRLSVAALLAGVVPASAAEVAIIKSNDAVAPATLVGALRHALMSHVVTEHDVHDDAAQAARVVDGLKSRPVVFIALGPVAARAVRDAAPASRLAFAMVPYPADDGLFGVPHVAGVIYSLPVRLQIASFRTVAPRAVRLGVVFDARSVGPLVEEAVAAARTLRVEIVPKPVRSPRDVPAALRELLSGDTPVDALWLPPDPLFLTDEARRHFLKSALDAKRPVLAFSPSIVAEGALASQSADLESVGQQLAHAALRLAAGETSDRIGVLVPKGLLTVNGKVGQRLKIEIRDDVRQRARIL